MGMSLEKSLASIISHVDGTLMANVDALYVLKFLSSVVVAESPDPKHPVITIKETRALNIINFFIWIDYLHQYFTRFYDFINSLN